ncbi:MAG: hypothetical protein KDI39_06040 [Pseudomonadales bacterium]|nr:hypothetical protein [Pseudomonadales bacterium]
MYYAYLFEARSIQRFLFSTGKLKDMIQGSELIDYICTKDGYLDQVLNKLKLKPKAPRRAGGTFYLVFNTLKDAQRMQALWRLAIAQWLPGLEKVDAISEGTTAREAVKKGIEKLSSNRNIIYADLPAASPLTERSPRTGLAAVKREQGESIDAATCTIRQFKRLSSSEPLTTRFLKNHAVYWPNNFEQAGKESLRFPLHERQLIGLVHADGNGLGIILRQLDAACEKANDKTYLELYRFFSDGLGDATVNAARDASDKELLPHTHNNIMPARPLVLGGDDLSIIVRADLALPYTQAFLIAFEMHSQTFMHNLKAKFKEMGLSEYASQLPNKLTACAGVVFMKCSQPFHSAYDLAEGLCKRAKNTSREHSSISFFKVNDSVLEDVEQMIEQTQTAVFVNKENPSDKSKRTYWHLGLPAYGISSESNLPLLSDLYKLRDLFSSPANATKEYPLLNDRPLREIATLIHVNTKQAQSAYQRWQQMCKRTNTDNLKKFDDTLSALLDDCIPDLPFKKEQENSYRSILADLLGLLTIKISASTTGDQ